MTVSTSRIIQHKERASATDAREVVTDAAVAGAADLRAEIEQLRETMDSRAVIEQARRMLMAVASCSGPDAWRMLVEITQHRNVKLPDIAAAPVATCNRSAAATRDRAPPTGRHWLGRETCTRR